MPQSGDECLEAAGAEEVVVAPEVQQDVLGGDDGMRMATEAFQYLAFPVGQFVAFAGGQVGQCPFAGVELVVADLCLLFRSGRFVSSLSAGRRWG